MRDKLCEFYQTFYCIHNCDRHCEADPRTDIVDIQLIKDQGHTLHCAQRQVWGDGECECRFGDDYPGKMKLPGGL